MIDNVESPATPTVFHERHMYRRRRTMDAARMTPILALVLWLLPLVWPQVGEGRVSSASALVFIFTVWAGVIVLTWGLSRMLTKSMDDPVVDDT